jgi:hypothetical protein
VTELIYAQLVAVVVVVDDDDVVVVVDVGGCRSRMKLFLFSSIWGVGGSRGWFFARERGGRERGVRERGGGREGGREGQKDIDSGERET